MISVFFSYIHLRVLGYEGFVLSRKVILVSLIVFIMFIASFLTGVIHEVSALSPTVGYFVGIGMANIESNKNGKQAEMVLYIIALVGVIFLNFMLNILA